MCLRATSRLYSWSLSDDILDIITIMLFPRVGTNHLSYPENPERIIVTYNIPLHVPQSALLRDFIERVEENERIDVHDTRAKANNQNTRTPFLPSPSHPTTLQKRKCP